jgi:hypothetical protein
VLSAPRRSLVALLSVAFVAALAWIAVPAAGAQNITDTSVPLDESALFGGSGELVKVIDPAAAAAGTITLVQEKPFQPNLQFTGTVSALAEGDWTLHSALPGVLPDTLMPTVKSVFGLDFLASKTVKLHLDNTSIVGSTGFRSTVFGYYADIRPSELTRFYISGRTEYDSTEDPAWKFPLLEAFADTAIGRSVFFRFGKQYVSWGVGYWYSPADVLSLAQIDPEDPEAKREGPFAFKVDVPFKQNLFTAYVIGDRDLEPLGTAIAAKADIVTGSFELSLGGYYRPDLAVRPRLIAMFSGAAGPLDIFGEGVAAWGADRTFVRSTESGPGIYRIENQPVFQATAGLSWSYDHKDKLYSIDTRAQVYYNGMGYEDTSYLRSAAVRNLVQAGTLSALDLTQAGRWYAAASASISKLFDEVLAFSLTSIANISDSIVKVTPKITITPNYYPSIAIYTPLTFTDWAAPDKIELKVDLSYWAFTF